MKDPDQESLAEAAAKMAGEVSFMANSMQEVHQRFVDEFSSDTARSVSQALRLLSNVILAQGVSHAGLWALQQLLAARQACLVAVDSAAVNIESVTETMKNRSEVYRNIRVAVRDMADTDQDLGVILGQIAAGLSIAQSKGKGPAADSSSMFATSLFPNRSLPVLDIEGNEVNPAILIYDKPHWAAGVLIGLRGADWRQSYAATLALMTDQERNRLEVECVSANVETHSREAFDLATRVMLARLRDGKPEKTDEGTPGGDPSCN